MVDLLENALKKGVVILAYGSVCIIILVSVSRNTEPYFQ